MLFAEGTYVNKNQVLFVINQDQYRAKATRHGSAEKDEAQALKAERDLKRIRPLYEQMLLASWIWIMRKQLMKALLRQ